ncbi:hypothetical protein F4779DRAFT_247862 [Xylariaceae sp. FL0662B]|nr:hypothetical protein F4779DRAFT_247862 [Xylariaceae sp. FL0662B]
MAPNQDLTLPKTAPNNDRHRGTAGENYIQAVYSMLPLDRSTLDNLVERLNAAEDIMPDACGLAPKPDFANYALRDIYDYHLRLRDEDNSIHPLYFIVAISADYENNGVLVVHLDTGQDEQQDRVDKARCSVDYAASWGLNLDIGNMDWEDLKEEEEGEWGNSAMPWTPESHQPAQPVTSPPRWQYACFSLVEKALDLPHQLDPNWLDTPVEYRRIIMSGNYSTTADGFSEIVRLFPWFCKSHPETHRQMVILADRPDFETDGVMLLRFDWDGNVDVHDDESITSVKLNYEKVKRVPSSKAVTEIDEYCRDHGLPQAYLS